jgi:hypothetical protein
VEAGSSFSPSTRAVGRGSGGLVLSGCTWFRVDLRRGLTVLGSSTSSTVGGGGDNELDWQGGLRILNSVWSEPCINGANDGEFNGEIDGGIDDSAGGIDGKQLSDTVDRGDGLRKQDLVSSPINARINGDGGGDNELLWRASDRG